MLSEQMINTPMSSRCRYYDVGSFSNLCLDSFTFSIFHINIRSYNRNADEFFIFMRQLPLQPTVMVFSETWFSDVFAAELEGYTSFHVYRTERRGGGVSIFVKSDFKARSIAGKSGIFIHSEISSVEIEFGETKVRVIGIYRPPDRDCRTFSEDTEMLLADADSSVPTFVIGDLNLDLLDQTTSCSSFVDVMNSSSFSSLIDIPTYFSYANNPACLDHVWYNQPDETVSGAFNVDISDHFPIFSLVSLPPKSNDGFLKSFRDHSENSLSALRDATAVFTGDFSVGDPGDVDQTVTYFCERLYQIYDECCPIRKKCYSSNRRSKPWISRELIDCIDRKHSLFRQYKAGNIQFQEYNAFKNMVTRVVRNAKARYYNEELNRSHKDAKSTWRIVNSLTGRGKRKVGISELRINDELVQEPLQIAEYFNNHFSGVAERIDRSIPPATHSFLEYLGNPNPNSMYVTPSTPVEVSSIICNLVNKSTDIRSLPVFIYKYCSDMISPVISMLFNLSLESGIFPTCLKDAIIVPIHKAGSVNCLDNYRPISLLSILSKIFEKLMAKRLKSFLDTGGLLNSNQFGFRENSSTSDALLQFMEYTSVSLNNRNTLISIFLDFSKAFDTVCHDILLDKLERIGVRGVIRSWFCSYLSNRQQSVVLDGALSSKRVLSRGVPQGSVLGPTLFLVYINDMMNSCSKLNLIHFADDTTAFLSLHDQFLLMQNVNEDLESVNKWLCANRLSLNVDKTSYMLIGDSVQPDLRPIVISGNMIRRVDSSKFLGIYIDDKLNFKKHTDYVSGRLSRAIGIIYRVSHLITPEVKIKMYYSLIFSIVSYGISVWGRSSVAGAARLDRLLNRAKKVVNYNGVGYSSVADRLLSFDHTYIYFTAVKLYKTVKLGFHGYFEQILLRLLPHHNHSTRLLTSEKFNPPQLFKSKCQKTFLYQSIKIWNDLPDNIRSCDNIGQFKTRLREHILSSM